MAKFFENDSCFINTISPRLESIMRKIALIASQITTIIERELNIDKNSATPLQLQQILQHISAVTTDIESLAGKKFDPAVMKATKESIGELVDFLENNQSVPLDKKLMIQKLTEISSNIPVAICSETVCCPYCHSVNEIKIGSIAPYSAMPICQYCNKQFHANRQHDGSIKISKKGSH